MSVIIHQYYHGLNEEQFKHIKNELHLLHEKVNIYIHQINSIMSTQTEIAQALTDLTAQVVKIGAESTATLQKVADLEAALANQDNVSPALQSAFDALKAQVQTVDDLIPDAPATPPTDTTTNQ